MKIFHPTLVHCPLATRRCGLLTPRAGAPLLGAIALLAGLGGCKRDAPAAPTAPPAVHNATPAFSAATTTPAAAPAVALATGVPDSAEQQRQRVWMRAIFGGAYDPAKNQAVAQLENDGSMADHLMTLVSSRSLPDGRVVVVVNGALADEDGKEIVAHGAPGVLNVYVLRAEGAGWQVAERRESLSTMGSWSNIGIVDWIELAPGKPGFIVKSSGTWQGYTGVWAHIIELGAPMRELGTINLASDNEGGCGPDTDCWDVEGVIRFADGTDAANPPDMLVDFSGRRYHFTEDPDQAPDQDQGRAITTHHDATIRQTARYRFDGKAYALVEGSNPVPDF
jgi:hypothetical protein